MGSCTVPNAYGYNIEKRDKIPKADLSSVAINAQKRSLILFLICYVFRSNSGALKKEVHPQTGY